MFEHTEQLLAELGGEEHGADDDDDDDEAGPSVDNIEDDFIQSSDEEDDAMDHWLNVFHLFYSNCHPWTHPIRILNWKQMAESSQFPPSSVSLPVTFFSPSIPVWYVWLKLGCIFCLPCFLHAETTNHQDICHTDLDTDQDGVS